MKASDQIIHCEICHRYAKKIAGENWREAFNIAWLKIREIEIKNSNKTIRNYKTYFYSALRSAVVDEQRKSNRIISESNLPIIDSFIDDDSNHSTKLYIELESDEYLDVWEIESKVLHDWLNRRTKDQDILFLQNIVNLALEFKSVKRAASKTKMSLRTFFKYLAAAKQEIENEHFSITDCHPLNEHDLV
jgi:hypothetical protein